MGFSCKISLKPIHWTIKINKFPWKISWNPPDPGRANQEKIEAEERAENERIEQFARDKREREATDGDLVRCNWDFMENIGISIIMCMILLGCCRFVDGNLSGGIYKEHQYSLIFMNELVNINRISLRLSGL